MPKFYCLHCGQHIDAPDQLAGSHSMCPTCDGEIAIPEVPEIQNMAPPALPSAPPPRPSVPPQLPSAPPNGTKPTSNRATKTKSKVGSIVGTGLLILVGIVAARSCGSFVAEKQLETAAAAQNMTLAGLSLDLSGTPQGAEFDMRKATPNAISQDSYVLQNDSTQFGITRTIHRSMYGSLDDNAQGVVQGQEKYTISDCFVDGLAAKRITMRVNESGNVQYICMLLFAKGNSLWQVAAIDPSRANANDKIDTLRQTIKVIE
jgi:hypothetical protein